MKSKAIIGVFVPGLMLAANSTNTPGDAPGSQLENVILAAEPPSLNHFGLSARMAFNMTVNFKGLGGFLPAPRLGGRMTADPNRSDLYNYDDGYVYADINQGAFDSTWYWGYDGNADQYTLGDDFLILHRSSAYANIASTDQGNEPQLGFELTYDRELGRRGHWRWGVEAGAGYTYVSADDRSTLSGDVTRESDAFAVFKDPQTGYGISYFQPPGWAHDYTSAGPLLGYPAASPGPADQIIAGGASISGRRQFDADVIGFRVGPYVEYSIAPRLTLALSGGLALAMVYSDLTIDDTVTITGAGTETHPRASGTDNDLMIGGYVAANIAYELGKGWGVFAGVQYQNLGNYSQTVQGRTAELEMDNTIYVTLGISYSF